jgi:Ran GTPase-activating protein (RanGAP) involved in mRNA processing and transport
MAHTTSENFFKLLDSILENNPKETYGYFASYKFNTDAMKLIAEALITNHTFTTVDLQRNHLDPKCMSFIAKVLEKNDTITTMNLADNYIDANDIKIIARALKRNNTLTSLNLAVNSLGAEGFEYLAQTLVSNHTLTEINLGCNNCGTKGAMCIAQVLRTNTTLTHLGLYSNNIDTVGIVAIMEALCVNNTLMVINVSYNEFDAFTFSRVFAKTLAVNNTLRWVFFQSRNDNNFYNIISDALTINPSITVLIPFVNNVNLGRNTQLQMKNQCSATLLTMLWYNDFPTIIPKIQKNRNYILNLLHYCVPIFMGVFLFWFFGQ